jgi:hypothetical protein
LPLYLHFIFAIYFHYFRHFQLSSLFRLALSSASFASISFHWPHEAIASEPIAYGRQRQLATHTHLLIAIDITGH